MREEERRGRYGKEIRESAKAARGPWKPLEGWRVSALPIETRVVSPISFFILPTINEVSNSVSIERRAEPLL